MIRGDRRGNGRELRLAAMTLFGSMNWIYTWYRPEVDGDAARLTDSMLGIFLRGFIGGEDTAPRRAGRRPRPAFR